MPFSELSRLLSLYKNCDQLLRKGSFGDGLWPLDPVSGQLLQQLIRFFRLRRGLEVGSGVGYSTAWMAAGMADTGGSVVAIEYFPPKVEQLERHMATMFSQQYSKIVQIVPSDVRRALPHLGPQKFDLVFFDQRKVDYLPHLKLLLPKLKRGAFVVADNVLSHPEACHDYVQFVRSDSRFASALLRIGQGLELSRYRG